MSVPAESGEAFSLTAPTIPVNDRLIATRSTPDRGEAQCYEKTLGHVAWLVGSWQGRNLLKVKRTHIGGLTTAAGDHAMEKITANDVPVPLLGEDWFDPLEAGVRQHIRSFIEAMLESE